MDIRSVQRTGNMHYMYLPTSWCKSHEVSSDTKVSVQANDDGSLTVYPSIIEEKPKDLRFTISETNESILHKVIVACYINPCNSFEIKLEKNLDFTTLLNQKKLISLELVELNKQSITCESSVLIGDVGNLIKTMVRKIRNLLIVMIKNYNEELIQKYEEEVDRSKLHIQKSIITALTHAQGQRLKTIDLYYLGQIANDLECLVDHIIALDKTETKFFTVLLEVSEELKQICEGLSEQTKFIDLPLALAYIRKVQTLEEIKVKDIKSYEKKTIKQLLVSIGEILLDWAITKKLED